MASAVTYQDKKDTDLDDMAKDKLKKALAQSTSSTAPNSSTNTMTSREVGEYRSRAKADDAAANATARDKAADDLSKAGAKTITTTKPKPSRSDFADGLPGQAAYSAAVRAWQASQ